MQVRISLDGANDRLACWVSRERAIATCQLHRITSSYCNLERHFLYDYSSTTKRRSTMCSVLTPYILLFACNKVLACKLLAWYFIVPRNTLEVLIVPGSVNRIMGERAERDSVKLCVRKTISDAWYCTCKVGKLPHTPWYTAEGLQQVKQLQMKREGQQPTCRNPKPEHLPEPTFSRYLDDHADDIGIEKGAMMGEGREDKLTGRS